MTRQCKNCGKEFDVQVSNQIFCSERCQRTSYEKPCVYCGKVFKGTKKRQYCSDECRKADYKTILEKIKKSNMEKHGVEYSFQLNAPVYKPKTEKKQRAKELDVIQPALFRDEVPDKSKVEAVQKEIYEFVKSFYNGEVLFNTADIIPPYELNVYIPEKKVAIEFKSLMFDSYGVSDIPLFNNYKDEDKKCFLVKTEKCEEQGIKLFYIFEDEWLHPVKREIWKSKIKIEMGFIETKINARDCEIKEVSSSESSAFLKANHLQGIAPSSVKLGLYYKNNLVELLTMGQSRFNKRYTWELTRACSKLNTTVRGGFSKLLKYFKEHYEGSIISYGNRRWAYAERNVYKENGSPLLTAAPNYFYFMPGEYVLMSRQRFQKHKLEGKLKTFDKDKTETENMYNNGYRRIYDCGNLVYQL